MTIEASLDPALFTGIFEREALRLVKHYDFSDDVTVELVLANVAKNVATSQQALRKLVPRLPGRRLCDCEHALATALVTAQELVPEATLQRLGPLVSKYMS